MALPDLQHDSANPRMAVRATFGNLAVRHPQSHNPSTIGCTFAMLAACAAYTKSVNLNHDVACPIFSAVGRDFQTRSMLLTWRSSAMGDSRTIRNRKRSTKRTGSDKMGRMKGGPPQI